MRRGGLFPFSSARSDAPRNDNDSSASGSASPNFRSLRRIGSGCSKLALLSSFFGCSVSTRWLMAGFQGWSK